MSFSFSLKTNIILIILLMVIINIAAQVNCKLVENLIWDMIKWFWRSCTEVFSKKSVFRSFAKPTGKHLCQSLFFNKKRGFCCKFCEVFQNIFFIEHVWTALSACTPNSFLSKLSEKIKFHQQMSNLCAIESYILY